MHTPPRLLVVDDQPMNVDILCSRLAVHGYDILTARTGDEALALATTRHPDLLLLDVLLPATDGLSVCRRLKAEASLPFMPVIMVSARTAALDVIAGLEAGADDYLTKPVDQAVLVARVQAMLRLKARHDVLQAQAAEGMAWSRRLEQQMQDQMAELARLGRLRPFVSPPLAELVLATGGEALLHPQRREVTVVCCAIQGFPAFAATAAPERVIEVLVPDEVRPLLVAQDYVWALNARKSALVVTPTHHEGERIAACIRDLLKKDGKLGRDERPVYRLRNLHWTDAEKADPAMYRSGQVVQFVQNAPGVVSGSRFTVVRGEHGVWFRDREGRDFVLPVRYTDRFQVYRAETLPLATGDVVRVTAKGKSLDGTKIDNGCVATVKGFTANGDICLSNGKTLANDFGHLMTGFYTTSYSGQSKTVDRVFVSAGTGALQATYLEQFLVAMSRGREGVRVYTDDKDGLRERIVHSGQRGSATELMAGQVAANTRPRDVTERAMNDREALRLRVAYRRKHKAHQELMRDRIAAGEGRRRGEWHERLQRSRQGADHGR